MFRKVGHIQVWSLERFKLSFVNIKLVNFQINLFAESEILKQEKSKIMYNWKEEKFTSELKSWVKLGRTICSPLWPCWL